MEQPGILLRQALLRDITRGPFRDTNNYKSERKTMETPTRLWMAMALLALLFAGIYFEAARAEYGDVVINEFSDEAGMRPVVFPHWFHRILP